MAYDEFKYRLITGILQMAGEGISNYLLNPTYDEEQKIKSEYYQKAKQIMRDRKEGETVKTETVQAFKQETTEITQDFETEKDLTTDKIEKGSACLPCSRDHLSTVSGALGEAIRFSRKEGVNHPEVQRRLGMSLDELNMLERIDLAPEQLVRLKGAEKELAQWGLNQARDLRHKITQVQSHEQLEKVAADASEIRTEYMRRLWNTATIDGSINNICKGLKDDEYKRCISTINTVLNDKKKI